MCDLIDRQAAIDELKKYIAVNRNPNHDARIWEEGMNCAVTVIGALPSAQPYTDKELQKIQDLEQSQFDKIYELGYQAGRSAQPEIIKCKDCLHWARTCGDNQWGLGDCDVFDKHLVMCEGYCAWAERREDGQKD